MPTAVSSTSTRQANLVDDTRRAVADVGHLLRFRAATVRRRSALTWLAVVFLGLTAAAAIGPAFVDGAGSGSGRAFDALLLLPTAVAGFLGLAVASAVASGGGRELLAREHATTFPVSPTTDHLGALLLAPLNIAWLIQAWVLLGATAYALPGDRLVAAQIGMVLWLVAATALGQVVAWSMEAVRRAHHGIAVVRVLAAALVSCVVALQVTGNLTGFFDGLPTRWIVVGLVEGYTGRWLLTLLVVAAIALAAVVLGAVPAHLAARRTPRDELRVESGTHPARPPARFALSALIRTDRGSVWRAVPMRRGMAVLAIGPGVVALIGDLTWSQMTILPGLVASGGALLFGVNAWCLDGRGGLWRESLPVPPWTVFVARAWVLAEFLLVASCLTLVLAALRAGVPTVAELTALLCTWLVVVLQVVSASMRWSSRRPFAVDLRSARATPAPPATMVGYSTKLAVGTTLTSLIFSGLARVPHWEVSVLAALPFVAWSLVRMLHARDAWVEPVGRARVVTTVAT